jgi:hypothetical protein
MAKIVFGGGVSHTPLLAIKAQDWKMRGEADRRNKALNLSDGRFVDYETLRAEVGDKYEALATEKVFLEKSALCQAALDKFSTALAASKPDVVVIVGNDHQDMFKPDNMPAFAVFYGDKVVTMPDHDFESQPAWWQDMMVGYAQDKAHVFPGSRRFALELIEKMTDDDVDVAISSHVPDGGRNGLGHAYGFVALRVMRSGLPMVPVLLNTYYPPNVPSPKRCLALGRALRRAIEASPSDLRVAIVASGGLSHFVVDESLDRSVLAAFVSENTDALAAIPRQALNSGSSEILNWVLAAGAIDSMTPRWSEYYPIYRTPAGSGVGIAVAARW